jgi:hypothetical protein
MLVGAFTFWFTITTLVGPGVCCCFFALSFHSVTPAAAHGQPVPAAKPVKSCCHQEAAPFGEHGEHNNEPCEPPKCLCKKASQVATLPPSTSANADISAQLKLIDALFVGLLASFAFDFVAISSATPDPTQPVYRLAGRDLLAAYSVLRC